MAVVHIENIKDELILYFDTADKSINAYTLASTLVALADAAKEANRIINPGYEIEVVVSALSEGSFKAVIRAVYKELKNLFSADSVRAIVLSILASMLYDKYFAQNDNISVNVSSDCVVISSSSEKIIIPKDVYDATQLVEKSKKVSAKIDYIGQTASKDNNIKGIGVATNIVEKPEVIIQRDSFERTFSDVVIEENDTRENTEITTVEILRAILEESDRRWEFVWYGNKISAPVLDEEFYKKFREHKITIAPGDKFEVRMKITQKKDKGSGIYINQKYEVIEVVNHISKSEQAELE